MIPRLALLVFFGALAVTGCDKDTEGDTGGDTSTSDELTWQAMSDSEKSAYMAGVVLPAMRDVFQGYDAERYAEFSCDTCHTSGGDYSMPSQDLAGYWAEGEFPGPDTTDPGAKFMHEEVLPKMAELLDDDSPSCTGCHIE
jgi:hypothetical protein